ncbi:hypothetical protein RchiOBHm_Chr4g0420541 [Rosa chinensis]|uniref:Uncharacterized protein n=1 Tax=Rosa chinensis TaxID=74649 RepID=A0A2P6QXV1_ROSCH|nr:hypothetical protein RchiOBHm_Chr4g0420541 [Rosa chinensis]
MNSFWWFHQFYIFWYFNQFNIFIDFFFIDDFFLFRGRWFHGFLEQSFHFFRLLFSEIFFIFLLNQLADKTIFGFSSCFSYEAFFMISLLGLFTKHRETILFMT